MIWGLRKPVEARGNGTKAPAAWAQIIDDYMLTLAAAGQPPTTTGIAPNPIGSDGQRHRRPSGRCCRGEVRRMVRAADRMDDRNAPQLPRRHPRILPVGIQNQAGARPSGRRAAQGTRATWATRAPAAGGPTAYEAICLTSGMSSASTGIICSVRSVCALHTTHCRPNVTFRIGLSGNNLWKQSKQIF